MEPAGEMQAVPQVPLPAGPLSPAAPAAPLQPPAAKRVKRDKNGKTKRTRAKKPIDAPRRPKSAYMFFLSQFREKWKVDNPEDKRVSEVAKAAGDAWRSLTAEQKAEFEEKSNESKAQYKVLIQEYEQEHPKPQRRQKKERDPSELKRPQSAYFFFLADFRLKFKKEHPENTSVAVVGKAAGEEWKRMPAEEKAPYVEMSAASKAEYARLKTLTPAERVMVAAAARMQQQDEDKKPADVNMDGGEPGAASL